MRKITTPNRVIVWGSGIISATDQFREPKAVLAVRGPTTAKTLRSLGYKSTKVFGDPAILLPILFKPTSNVTQRVGIVPHFIDHAFVSTNLKQKLGALGVAKIIDVTQPVEDVIEEINSCDSILSSSLHGLIVAHSYGKRAIWIKSIHKLDGDGSKFVDYLESFDLPTYKPLDLVQLTNVSEQLFLKYPLPYIADAQQDLLNLCPY